jgi:DeoR family deoxyribose operon repressor
MILTLALTLLVAPAHRLDERGSGTQAAIAMSDRRAERLKMLASALQRRGVLRLREAAAMLEVSEMTVRRDIASSPQRFAYLGGHIVNAADIGSGGAYVLEREVDSRSEAKSRACAAAVKLLAPDDTIFIDCGSTLIHLAELIPADMPLTVTCYSLNIANILAGKPNVRMILLGGVYHAASASFAGDEALEVLGRLGITKAFISAGGVDVARGVSCSNFFEVPIKQKAIGGAREKHLVVDESKFGTIRPAYFAKLDQFDSVITENGIRRPGPCLDAPLGEF